MNNEEKNEGGGGRQRNQDFQLRTVFIQRSAPIFYLLFRYEILSAETEELYVFDKNGRHLQTNGLFADGTQARIKFFSCFIAFVFAFSSYELSLIFILLGNLYIIVQCTHFFIYINIKECYLKYTYA